MQFYVFDSSAQMKELLGPLKILDNMMYYYDLYQEELEETKKNFFFRNSAKAKKTLYLSHLLERDIRLQISRISKIIYILPLNCRYYMAVQWIYACLCSGRTNSILDAAKLYQEELSDWSQEKKKLYEEASLQSRRFRSAFDTFWVSSCSLPGK